LHKLSSLAISHLPILYFFLSSSSPPLQLHSFPTRRSSDLTKTSDIRNVTCLPFAKRNLINISPVASVIYSTFCAECGVYDRCNRSEEHTSELQSRFDLVCRLLLEKKK